MLFGRYEMFLMVQAERLQLGWRLRLFGASARCHMDLLMTKSWSRETSSSLGSILPAGDAFAGEAWFTVGCTEGACFIFAGLEFFGGSALLRLLFGSIDSSEFVLLEDKAFFW